MENIATREIRTWCKLNELTQRNEELHKQHLANPDDLTIYRNWWMTSRQLLPLYRTTDVCRLHDIADRLDKAGMHEEAARVEAEACQLRTMADNWTHDRIQTWADVLSDSKQA